METITSTGRCSLVFSSEMWYFEANTPQGGFAMAFKRKIQSEPTILEHFKGGVFVPDDLDRIDID